MLCLGIFQNKSTKTMHVSNKYVNVWVHQLINQTLLYSTFHTNTMQHRVLDTIKTRTLYNADVSELKKKQLSCVFLHWIITEDNIELYYYCVHQHE